MLSSWGLCQTCFAEQPGVSSVVALPRAESPEAVGVASEGIQAFLDAVAQNKGIELHSFMMLRRGQVVAEAWWAPYAPALQHTMYSMSKSFTSTAVGLAVAEGRLKVDDKVISFFPDEAPKEVSENLAALRVKDLLAMAVGHEKDPTQPVVKSENWVQTFLAQPIPQAPGSLFVYNSAATYMCSAIVQKLTGQTMLDYLKPRLFEPLGIQGMTWETYPMGINTGGWGLSVPTEALAKFGQLYLQKGEWNGKRILPAAWIEEATAKHIQQPLAPKPGRSTEENDWKQGYGYQFWRSQHGAYRGDGAFGQFTVVLPEQDAVVVMTGESADMQAELDLVWKHLLPALSAEPALKKNSEANVKLRETLKGAQLPPPKGVTTSPHAVEIGGKTFKLANNPLGLTKFAVFFADGSCTLKVQEGDKMHEIQHGLEHWQQGETRLPGTPPRLISGGAPKEQPLSPLVASATWKTPTTLELTWRYIETPHHDTVTCSFVGKEVEIRFLNSLLKMRGKTEDSRPLIKGRVSDTP